MKVSAFSPANDIPDLTGKVILVTGGTGGLGKETVVELVKHQPKLVLFTGRDAKRAKDVIALAKKANSGTLVAFIPCDFSSLSSVKSASEKILSQTPHRLDVLICNAGIMCVEPGITKDGYEIQLGTNHLSHALLIKLLLATLQETPESRIVSLSSSAMAFPPKGGIAFDTLKSSQSSGLTPGMTNYAQSKLANILYAREIARRYPDVTSISIHPGIVNTHLIQNLSWLNYLLVKLVNPRPLLAAEFGAYHQLWAATVPKVNLINGHYYGEPVGEKGKDTKESKDDQLAKKLYDWTDKELQSFL